MIKSQICIEQGELGMTFFANYKFSMTVRGEQKTDLIVTFNVSM